MTGDRTVYTRLKADISDFQRGMLAASASARSFTNELDTSTSRTANLTQGLLAIGPALVPLSAAAVPAIAGLTSSLAFATAGAGVAVLAFQGFGKALKATNDFAIDPTGANLKKMQESLAKLGPAGRDFVNFLQEIRPQLQGLQDAAQAGLFPGAQAGIADLMSRLPQVERVISEIASAGGQALAEAGANLADPKWNDFFDFLEKEARPTLLDFSRSLGNLGEGFANLWMAFDPLSSRFSDSFLQMTRDFVSWTDGLSQTQGFQEFLDYIERTGPKTADALSSIGSALLQIVEAAAPVGEAALPVISAFADSIAAVADSDLGPTIIGIVALTSAYSRLIAVSSAASVGAMGGLLGRSAFGGAARAARDLPAATRAYMDYGAAMTSAGAQTAGFVSTSARLGAALGGTAKIAGGIGGLAFVMSDLDNKMGLTKTAMLGLAGSMAGPWGAALGAGVGLVMDLSSANDGMWTSMDRANKIIGDGTAPLEQQRAALDESRQKLDALASSADGVFSRFSTGGIKNGIEDLFGRSDVEEATQAWDRAADQYDKNADKARDLRLAEAGLSGALQGTTDAARDQVDAMLQVIQVRNDIADETLTALDAELKYEAAIDAATTAGIKGKDGLDSHTDAGRKNLGLLGDLAGAWNDLPPAMQNAKGASDRARASFITAAEGMGASKKKAKELADELLHMPSNVSVDVNLSGVGPATKAARDLRAALLAIPDITEATIRTIQETYIVPKKPKREPKHSLADMLNPNAQANGSVLSFYADGGTREQHIAQIAPAGAMRVWAEPETGGEAYIPLAPAKRVRSRSIAEQTIGLLGGSVQWYANGGIADRYTDFQALTHSSKLDLARQEQQILDIEKSLREKETVGKGKDKHTRATLRGHAREVAVLELQAAKAELAKMKRENAELKHYGTPEQEDARNTAVQEAEQVVRDAADRFTSAKTSAADRFTIGSATSAAQVDRNLARLLTDSKTFLGLLGDLKSKGASPWLLSELVKAGPTPGAIRLAREYDTNQAALDSVNAQAAQIDQYTNAYAGLVSNSAFYQPAPWNSGVSSASQGPTIIQNIYPPVEASPTMIAQQVAGQLMWRMN